MVIIPVIMVLIMVIIMVIIMIIIVIIMVIIMLNNFCFHVNAQKCQVVGLSSLIVFCPPFIYRVNILACPESQGIELDNLTT